MTRTRLVSALLTCVVVAACATAQPAPTATPTGATTSSSPTAPAQSATPAPTARLTAAPSQEPATLSPSPGASPTATATVPPTPTASASPEGSADPLAIRLGIERFADGFEALTFVTNAGDGSGLLYAVEQRGVIWTLDAEGVVGEAPFLDMSERVTSGGEQGLLGLAFHPDFASNGRFFVDYTATNGDMVVAEFGLGADGDGDPGSERRLLDISDPFPNHNGGMLAFGPDGYLYIGNGDGGSGGDPLNSGQSLDTLLGKILRIDVNSGDPYGIPTGNPFPVGNLAGARPEIWAYGLRNPWRFSFDRLTGALFIGDVGQGAWEEVDVEPPGAGGRNYGWNTMEGDTCFVVANCSSEGLTLPVTVYPHEQGCSITGGYVYRGSRFGPLSGGYVFSDYCSGRLWVLDAQDALETGSAELVQLGRELLHASSFGEDESGEIYVVDQNGTIYHLITRT